MSSKRHTASPLSSKRRRDYELNQRRAIYLARYMRDPCAELARLWVDPSATDGGSSSKSELLYLQPVVCVCVPADRTPQHTLPKSTSSMCPSVFVWRCNPTDKIKSNWWIDYWRVFVNWNPTDNNNVQLVD